MKPTNQAPKGADPVELLLRRIAWRTFGAPLLTGTTMVGCTATEDLLAERRHDDEEGRLDAASGGNSESDASIPIAADGGAKMPDDAAAVRSDGALPGDAYDPCADGGRLPVQASGLRLREQYDYAAVREALGYFPTGDGGPETWTGTRFETLSETGEPCATATDPACSEKIAAHAEPIFPTYCPQACVEWSVVTTRGDQVERWAEPRELVQLLGTIDSVDDALMLVASHGYDVTCTEASQWSEPAEAFLRSVRAVESGYELLATTYATTCPVTMRRHRLLVTAAGEVQELEAVTFPPSGLCIGRVPAGLRMRSETTESTSFGDHLAQCAALEAASVYAFARLAEELHAHRAPAEFITRALAAATDEVRHAETMTQLALEHDGVPMASEVRVLPLRSLEEIARENAVEGCVRETYGALVGIHQAAHAEDAALREAMHSIAEDETRHAVLSHHLHAWLMAQLDAPAQARVRAAQQRASTALLSECEREPDSAWRALAGLPSAHTARALATELARELWQVPLTAA